MSAEISVAVIIRVLQPTAEYKCSEEGEHNCSRRLERICGVRVFESANDNVLRVSL